VVGVVAFPVAHPVAVVGGVARSQNVPITDPENTSKVGMSPVILVPRSRCLLVLLAVGDTASAKPEIEGQRWIYLACVDPERSMC